MKTGRRKAKGRPITTEEFERMLAAVERVRRRPPNARKKERTPLPCLPIVAASWRHMLEGLWVSGLRLGEAMELSWDDPKRILVELAGENSTLCIPGVLQKNDRDQTLPITPEFVELLERTPEDQRTGFVFHPLDLTGRKRINEAANVSPIIRDIGAAAGVKVAEKNGKVKFASAHDLRRSFGNRWAQRLLPAELMLLMRHADIKTTMDY